MHAVHEMSVSIGRALRIKLWRLAVGVAMCGCALVLSDGVILATPKDDLVSALSQGRGSRSSVEVTHDSDGQTKVTVRGDQYDARPILKRIVAGLTTNDLKNPVLDIDLDIRVTTLTGFNGEALRDVALNLSGKNGSLLTFDLTAKIRGAAISGDFRAIGHGSRRVLYVETGDAGALLRFAGSYPDMAGGSLWIALDPPAPGRDEQDGIVNVRDFFITGDPIWTSKIKPLLPAKPDTDPTALSARVEFQSFSDRLVVREALARNSDLGATADGEVNYTNNAVNLHGSFVPLFAAKDAPAPSISDPAPQGGGLVGLKYQLTGSPHEPVLRIDPLGPLEPGQLRAFGFDTDGK
jgi:hypothetical protein